MQFAGYLQTNVLTSRTQNTFKNIGGIKIIHAKEQLLKTLYAHKFTFHSHQYCLTHVHLLCCDSCNTFHQLALK